MDVIAILCLNTTSSHGCWEAINSGDVGMAMKEMQYAKILDRDTLT